MKCAVISVLLFLFYTVGAYADSFDALLEKIRSESSKELKENKIREQRFLGDRKKRTAMLREAQSKLNEYQNESDMLKSNIDANEGKIAELEEKLQLKLGDTGELFGLIRQISGELAVQFEQSMISVHYPERVEFLNTLAERKELPDTKVLEDMWLIMLEELDESRNVSRFRTMVVQNDGTKKEQEVVRIGAYGAVSDGAYLTYSSEGNIFAKASKQPQMRYRSSISNFHDPADSLIKIMIDPTRGQLLNMLARKPDLKERIRQGGVIGYIIIGLGCSGLLLCFIRYGYLSLVERRIKKQARNLKVLSTDNPLGRIAAVYNAVREKSKEEKDVVWEEAVLKEIPRVERYNTLIKLLAAISPLLGLLGTVTGMIITFQSITLFGTSDPKLMAGGISTALVTTVLGLTVAIPMLFAYTLIASKSKNIIDVIEHQSIGLIAKDVL